MLQSSPVATRLRSVVDKLSRRHVVGVIATKLNVKFLQFKSVTIIIVL